MDVAIVRKPGERDRIYVRRDDGTEEAWQFPTYHELPAHDLVHFLVEQELGITDGFWGLVAGGAHVALVDNEATIVRDGRPLVDDPGVDFTGLQVAEACVARIGGLAFATSGEPPVVGERSGPGEPSDPVDGVVAELTAVIEALDGRLPPGLTPAGVGALVARLRAVGADWAAFGGRPKGGAVHLTW